MAPTQLYLRYRRWASKFGLGTSVALGMAAAMAGVVLVWLLPREVALWKVLPWLTAIGGPLAAFDAWGAAAHRGRPGEGFARAAFIMVLCWGFTVYALFVRG